MSDGTIKDPKVKDVSNTIKARYDCGIENQKSVGCMVLEPVICASRGRNSADLNDRTAGAHTEQHLEPKNDGTCNTIATVSKDNLLLEPVPRILQVGNLIPDADRKFTNPQTGRVYDPDGLAPTLNTMQGGGRVPKIIKTTQVAYRIRNLTPRECFRLMGFTDAEFDRIKGVSNTQLYKQAGNSIVVNVLEAIFNRLLTDEEKA